MGGLGCRGILGTVVSVALLGAWAGCGDRDGDASRVDAGPGCEAGAGDPRVTIEYEAEPAAGATAPSPAVVERAAAILCDRFDASGLDAGVELADETALRVSAPGGEDDVDELRAAIEPAGLFLYELEPNVVPLDNRAQPDEVTPEELPAQSTTSLHTAVEVAAAQRPDPGACERLCSRDGAAYYAFERKSFTPVAGPEESRGELLAAVPRAGGDESLDVLEVPVGTVLVADVPDDRSVDPPPRYFVLRDRPALSGADITDPDQGTDELTGEPTITFDFTPAGRRAFALVTRRIAQNGAASLGNPYSFAIVLGGEILSRPVIDYNANPNGIDGRTGVQIAGLSAEDMERVGALLETGALPVDLAVTGITFED